MSRRSFRIGGVAVVTVWASVCWMAYCNIIALNGWEWTWWLYLSPGAFVFPILAGTLTVTTVPVVFALSWLTYSLAVIGISRLIPLSADATGEAVGDSAPGSAADNPYRSPEHSTAGTVTGKKSSLSWWHLIIVVCGIVVWGVLTLWMDLHTNKVAIVTWSVVTLLILGDILRRRRSA